MKPQVMVRSAAMSQRSSAGSNLATLSEVPGTELRQLQASFESFREFVARYSPWLSDACIFVETLEDVPVGAPVRLEIWLRERPSLIPPQEPRVTCAVLSVLPKPEMTL